MKWIRLSGVVSLFLSIVIFIVYLVEAAKRPSPFFWLPIVLFLSVGVTNLIWPWQQSRKKVDKVDMFFAKYWPQTRAIHAVLFLIGLSIGLFLFGLVFWRWGNNTVWGTTFFVALVSGTITLGLYHLWRTLHFDNAHYAALRQMLNHRLQDVMWLYQMPLGVPVEGDGEPTSDDPALYFWLADGSVQRIDVPDSVIRPLFTFIQEQASHVSIGYNPDLSDIVQHSKDKSSNYE